MPKPMVWIFIGGSITLLGGFITIVATYYHNQKSSAKTDRIESGVKLSNAGIDSLRDENKSLSIQLDGAQASIVELSGKLDPFIELAKSKHPGKSEQEALELLKNEFGRVTADVAKTKSKYKVKLSNLNQLMDNQAVSTYQDANRDGEFPASDFGVDILRMRVIEFDYFTELQRTDVIFAFDTDAVVAGTVQFLDAGMLSYIRGHFTDNKHCVFKINHPMNGRYRITLFTVQPFGNLTVYSADDSPKMLP